MRIIKVGNTFRTYDDSLETFDKLPAQNYVVRFQKNSGFFLEKYADIEIKEKTYGVHMSKVEKVLKAFPKAEKNLGVILSGNKGIGKSLFAKTLAVEATKVGLPVIIVDTYIPGIASFIEEIEQEVMNLIKHLAVLKLLMAWQILKQKCLHCLMDCLKGRKCL